LVWCRRHDGGDEKVNGKFWRSDPKQSATRLILSRLFCDAPATSSALRFIVQPEQSQSSRGIAGLSVSCDQAPRKGMRNAVSRSNVGGWSREVQYAGYHQVGVVKTIKSSRPHTTSQNRNPGFKRWQKTPGKRHPAQKRMQDQETSQLLRF
jgi:hypothetical protein